MSLWTWFLFSFVWHSHNLSSNFWASVSSFHSVSILLYLFSFFCTCFILYLFFPGSYAGIPSSQGSFLLLYLWMCFQFHFIFSLLKGCCFYRVHLLYLPFVTCSIWLLNSVLFHFIASIFSFKPISIFSIFILIWHGFLQLIFLLHFFPKLFQVSLHLLLFYHLLLSFCSSFRCVCFRVIVPSFVCYCREVFAHKYLPSHGVILQLCISDLHLL